MYIETEEQARELVRREGVYRGDKPPLELTGKTVILVSHSIEQIERMCNKVAWLDHGHLRRLGPTKEVTAEYRKFEKKDAMKADKVEG